MSDKTIYDMSSSDLAKQLLGKRIVTINEDAKTCSLDDGTVLEFEDTGDCCAWFSAHLKEGNLVDNAITAIDYVDVEHENSWEQRYDLHVLAADKRVMAVEITGDPTSGYYCHSINLKVKETSTNV